MILPKTVADVLKEHITLEVESIDRMYLNLYIPILQREPGIAYFWRSHRGYSFASSALMQPMSRDFVSRIESFALREGIDLIQFKKGERKDDIAKQYLEDFQGDEGVLFIGKAQEKTSVVRTQRRTNPETGQTYAWLYKSTAMVNHYYFYCVDRNFGPFFIKFCSYFPYNGKVCINGHEYAKRQLARKNVKFEPLDNGILSCRNPKLLQQICDGLSAAKIDALVRKWLRRLPHAFTRSDRRAGFCYDISILQAEFSLTQVLDRPVAGRIFFEQAIRDNLDLGRPDKVQLIFARRVTRRTPGRFRTRVITAGVIPSLYVDYMVNRIKQYFKEGRALRTETIINNTRQFGIGKRLHNLSELRKVGFQANRRLLSVQRISHDAFIGEDAFAQLQRPVVVDQQRASALRFGDQRALALLSALVFFRLLPRGFRNRDLRQHVGPLLALTSSQITQGKMTYDLRRLRLHGLIERVPKSHRYQVTDFGFRAALFLTRAYLRLLNPGMAAAIHQPSPTTDALDKALDRVDQAVARIWDKAP